MKGLYIIGTIFLIQGTQIVLSYPAAPDPPAEKSLTNSACPPGQASLNELNPTCYNIGGQGPCGKYMTFSKLMNDTEHGYCSCQQIGHECASRPMLFWPQENRCYPIYDKGPCKDGEWLTTKQNSRSLEPICETNPCSSSNQHGTTTTSNQEELLPSTEFTFQKDDKCFKTNSQAFCPVRKVAYFPTNSPQPICGQPATCFKFVLASVSNVAPKVGCLPGSVRDVTGDCVPLANLL